MVAYMRNIHLCVYARHNYRLVVINNNTTQWLFCESVLISWLEQKMQILAALRESSKMKFDCEGT